MHSDPSVSHRGGSITQVKLLLCNLFRTLEYPRFQAAVLYVNPDVTKLWVFFLACFKCKLFAIVQQSSDDIKL